MRKALHIEYDAVEEALQRIEAAIHGKCAGNVRVHGRGGGIRNRGVRVRPWGGARRSSCSGRVVAFDPEAQMVGNARPHELWNSIRPSSIPAIWCSWPMRGICGSSSTNALRVHSWARSASRNCQPVEWHAQTQMLRGDGDDFRSMAARHSRDETREGPGRVGTQRLLGALLVAVSMMEHADALVLRCQFVEESRKARRGADVLDAQEIPQLRQIPSRLGGIAFDQAQPDAVPEFPARGPSWAGKASLSPRGLALAGNKHEADACLVQAGQILDARLLEEPNSRGRSSRAPRRAPAPIHGRPRGIRRHRGAAHAASCTRPRAKGPARPVTKTRESSWRRCRSAASEAVFLDGCLGVDIPCQVSQGRGGWRPSGMMATADPPSSGRNRAARRHSSSRIPRGRGEAEAQNR